MKAFQVGNKQFREFEKKGYGWTDRRTDGPTDRQTTDPLIEMRGCPLETF